MKIGDLTTHKRFGLGIILQTRVTDTGYTIHKVLFAHHCRWLNKIFLRAVKKCP